MKPKTPEAIARTKELSRKWAEGRYGYHRDGCEKGTRMSTEQLEKIRVWTKDFDVEHDPSVFRAALTVAVIEIDRARASEMEAGTEVMELRIDLGASERARAELVEALRGMVAQFGPHHDYDALRLARALLAAQASPSETKREGA